jgi:hypothetical protein
MSHDDEQDDLEFEREDLKTPDGRNLYLYTFPEPEEGP